MSGSIGQDNVTGCRFELVGGEFTELGSDLTRTLDHCPSVVEQGL